MKHWITPLLAILVFGLLLGWVLWGGSSPESAEVDQGSSEICLLDAAADDVVEVRVSWIDREDLTIQASGKGDDRNYQLMSPAKRPTDQDRGQLLFTSAAALRVDRVIEEDPEEYSQFGLDQPVAHLVVKLEDGRETALLIGESSPLSSGEEPDRYVKLDDSDTVYLMTGTRLEFYAAPFERWRDPAMLRLEEVQSVDISSPVRQWSATRTDDLYGWKLTQPLELPAVSKIGDELVQTYDGFRVEEFEMDDPNPDDLRDYGLDEPSTTVTFRQHDGSEKEVLIGTIADSKGETAYAMVRGEPYVYTIKTGQYAVPALTSEYEWIAFQPFSPIKRHQVRSVKWKWHDLAGRLVRGDQDWLLYSEDNDPESLQEEKAHDLVDAVLSISAPDAVASSDGPDKAPEAGYIEITTGDPDNLQTIRLLLGDTPDGVFGQVEGYEGVYLFGEVETLDLLISAE